MKKELIAEHFQKFENVCFAESWRNGRFEKKLSKKKDHIIFQMVQYD